MDKKHLQECDDFKKVNPFLNLQNDSNDIGTTEKEACASHDTNYEQHKSPCSLALDFAFHPHKYLLPNANMADSIENNNDVIQSFKEGVNIIFDKIENAHVDNSANNITTDNSEIKFVAPNTVSQYISQDDNANNKNFVDNATSQLVVQNIPVLPEHSLNAQVQRKKTTEDYLEEHIDTLDIFLSEEREAYVTILLNSYDSTVTIDSDFFEYYLMQYMKSNFQTRLSQKNINDAKRYANTKAKIKNKSLSLYNRFVFNNHKFYWDLSQETAQYVSLDSNGWSLTATSPVKFIRQNTHVALPTPSKNGDILDLLPFINAKSINDKILIVVWLIVAFITSIPRPILCLNGTQGSAKTTLANMLKSICDPTLQGCSHMGSKESDVILAMQKAALPAFDNLTQTPKRIQDILCLCVTGGGFEKRKNYTDSDTIVYSIKRPIIITGINIPYGAHDLIDRTLSVELTRIKDCERKTESEVYKHFEQSRASIMGGILDVLVVAIKNYHDVQLNFQPRMLDFAQWGAYVADAIGQLSSHSDAKYFNATTFLSAIQTAIQDGYRVTVADDKLFQKLVDYLQLFEEHGTTEIELPTGQFYANFNDYVAKSDVVTDYLPKTAQHFSKELKQYIPALEAYGWATEICRGKGNFSFLKLTKINL